MASATQVLVQILQLGQVIGEFVVIGEQLALKIKSHFELDPNFTVNLQRLSGDAYTADQATIEELNAWRQSVGLKPFQETPLS